MAIFDAVAMDDDADGDGASEVAAEAIGAIGVLDEDEVAKAQVIEAKAFDFLAVGGDEVVVALLRVGCANARAHKAMGDDGGDGDLELAIDYL